MEKSSKVIHIRIGDDALAIVNALAEKEKLPLGTCIRRLVLLEAERQGISLSGKEQP